LYERKINHRMDNRIPPEVFTHIGSYLVI
jgi:hypothetical protein